MQAYRQPIAALIVLIIAAAFHFLIIPVWQSILKAMASWSTECSTKPWTRNRLEKMGARQDSIVIALEM